MFRQEKKHLKWLLVTEAEWEGREKILKKYIKKKNINISSAEFDKLST